MLAKIEIPPMDFESVNVGEAWRRWQQTMKLLLTGPLSGKNDKQNNQQQSEGVDQYVTELKNLARHCAFGEIENEMIRDRIVCGTKDKQVPERLLQEADLTLQKARDVARSFEMSKEQMKEMQCDMMSFTEFVAEQVRCVQLTRLFGYGGVPLRILGLTTLQCQYKEVSKSFDFIVVDHDDVHSPPVLGLKACREMGLIQVVLTITNSPDCESALREILKEFKDVFQVIGCIEDEYCIQIEENAVPVVHAVRKGPLALDTKIQKELQRMEDLGVICKVDEPTSWVNSMVVAPESNGEIRLCLDPTDLNKVVKREHYRMPTLQDITPKLVGQKYFTVLDAKSSFWQIPLDSQLSLLTIFNTPFGRYRFMRLPFGIKSASEIFQKRMDSAFEGLEHTQPNVDDILISAEHDSRLRQTLQRAKEKGIKLNPDKTQLCQQEVKFFGEILTSDGMKPDPDKVQAVRDMNTPTCKKELEGYFGMFTYLTQFAPSLSEKTHILSELTKQDTLFCWTPEHEATFQEIKNMITKSPGPILQYFDQKKSVTLETDASQNGLGAVIFQDKGPVAFASKAMTNSQRNYAQIEKEMLSILFGCEKFHYYLFGRNFKVRTDHKPLEVVFKKPLHAIPLRLQCMRMRLQIYDADVEFTPGKDVLVADMLSRYFIESLSNKDDLSLDEDIQSYVHMVTSSLPVSDKTMEEIRKESSEDSQHLMPMKIIMNGWPQNMHDCPSSIKEFWNFRDELTVIDGIVYKGDKIVIPISMRKETLEKIHTGHMGIVKCKERACDVIFWPRMTADIERTVQNCGTCQQNRMKQCKEPMITSEVPKLPWQFVATDLFQLNGLDYLLVVDYYSRYIEIALLSNTKSKTVITHMKSMFAQHGVPSRIVSDNGPQYASEEFREVVQKWNIEHITSSPLYPQANGLAEKSVQTVKRLLLKAKQSGGDPYWSLLAYRNTPLSEMGSSPAQLLMSRRPH
ncbi:uncharacterized protein K02A2.6-like [Haliotis rubra]|uniref:uncharacterized protein K02A2.6-like n=1 Tax=Haliotis rubra TaxID=36100 RepID=UPI001EE5A36C|nr:uncharacterized protein K02A2.6-like [Haliotis rubra]